MIRKTLTALTMIWLGAALATGCGTGVIEDGDEDDEPILLGGGAGGPDPESCPEPPEDCDGTIVTDEEGCLVCEQTSCDMCSGDQICSTCNYANGYSHSCHDVPTPTDDQFVCKWIACDVGEICLDTQPVGDGCPDAECGELPPECAADPTCACLESALGANGCSEDEDGNVTVTGSFFP